MTGTARSEKLPGSRRPTKTFANASIVSAERVVFDIKGGGYRLITAIDFEMSVVWIKWIGTHKDYDQIDARKVKYER